VAERVAAIRYAKAVFEIAAESNEFEQWQAELTVIAAIAADADILSMFENPKIDYWEKKKVLQEHLVSSKKLAQNLALLLVKEGRLAMVGDILSEYNRLYNSQKGVEQAIVKTAVPLTKQEKEELFTKLNKRFNKKIELEVFIDPSIISGMVVRVGGKLLDGSTRSKLKELRKEIGEAKI
jgi:F-type H+-transporting ATPase subunit delta